MTNKDRPINAVQCNHCGKTIVSESVHDFVSCACTDDDNRVCVDGGREYFRRVYGRNASWEEIGYKEGENRCARGPNMDG